MTIIFVKPSALSIDKQQGYVLRLTEEESPVSDLDHSLIGP